MTEIALVQHTGQNRILSHWKQVIALACIVTFIVTAIVFFSGDGVDPVTGTLMTLSAGILILFTFVYAASVDYTGN